MLKSAGLSLKRFTRVPPPEVVSPERMIHITEPRVERLTVAALRRVVTKRVRDGKGCGAPCDFCRVLVSSSDVEYELEAELDGHAVTLHFHPRCHEAWRAKGLRGEPLTARQ